MAHLAVIGSHHVNGVAALHSELLKTDLFPEFNALYPGKFTNVTNGVTTRRWMNGCNKPMSKLITETLGSQKWIKKAEKLAGLRQYASDPFFQTKWKAVKQKNKEKLASYISKTIGVSVPVTALFDIQVKRLHEYKRQLLNILYVVWRWKQISCLSIEQRADVVPRVVIFAGKAAPGYDVAKLIIKLINTVADKINNDSYMEGLLSVHFLPNYNVSMAEILIPASDISQHISTAGMEASGTSNMKFAMNGGLIIGTMDGANIEIREAIGEDNMFIFGCLAEEVDQKRKLVMSGHGTKPSSLEQVLSMVLDGTFGDFPECRKLIDTITHNNDYYLLAEDWEDYLRAQAEIDQTYKDQDLWVEKTILSTAGMGIFSADRCVQEYAEKIWDIKPCPRPGPIDVDPSLVLPVPSIHHSASPAHHHHSGYSPISRVAPERLSPLDRQAVANFSPTAALASRLGVGSRPHDRY